MIDRRPSPLAFRPRALSGAALCLLVLGGTAQAAPSRPSNEARAQLSFGVDMAKRGLWSEALFRFSEAEKLDPREPRRPEQPGRRLRGGGRLRQGARATTRRPSRLRPTTTRPAQQLHPLRRVLPGLQRARRQKAGGTAVLRAGRQEGRRAAQRPGRPTPPVAPAGDAGAADPAPPSGALAAHRGEHEPPRHHDLPGGLEMRRRMPQSARSSSRPSWRSPPAAPLSAGGRGQADSCRSAPGSTCRGASPSPSPRSWW